MSILRFRTLGRVDEATPHRFRTWLDERTDFERATAVLNERLARELEVDVIEEPDGRWRLDLASTFSPRTAAVMRPLNVMANQGVRMQGLEMIDIVDTASGREVRGAIRGWSAQANRGPYRRRLEALGGPAMIDLLLSEIEDAGSDNRRLSAARFALRCAAFNTPGSEQLVLDLARREPDWNPASDWVGAAAERAALDSLTGGGFEATDEALIDLAAREDYVGERAVGLLKTLQEPLGDLVVAMLCDLTVAADRRSYEAVAALAKAPPTPPVRRALEAAVASPDPKLQAAALSTLVHHWGEEARPIWAEFMESRSAVLREAAEIVVGTHGTDEDVPAAAARLGKLIRARPSRVVYDPPRGAELIDLLMRYRSDPAAGKALDDLSARWERLQPEMQRWVAAHHPSLDPEARADTPIEQDIAPEARLEWPPPEISEEADGLLLWFEDTDMFDTREAFETLARADDSVELVDGDREWLKLRIETGDPHTVVLRLWDQAGSSLES